MGLHTKSRYIAWDRYTAYSRVQYFVSLLCLTYEVQKVSCYVTPCQQTRIEKKNGEVYKTVDYQHCVKFGLIRTLCLFIADRFPYKTM